MLQIFRLVGLSLVRLMKLAKMTNTLAYFNEESLMKEIIKFLFVTDAPDKAL